MTSLHSTNSANPSRQTSMNVSKRYAHIFILSLLLWHGTLLLFKEQKLAMMKLFTKKHSQLPSEKSIFMKFLTFLGCLSQQIDNYCIFSVYVLQDYDFYQHSVSCPVQFVI